MRVKRAQITSDPLLEVVDPGCIAAAQQACHAQRLELEQQGQYSEDELDLWEQACCSRVAMACRGDTL